PRSGRGSPVWRGRAARRPSIQRGSRPTRWQSQAAARSTSQTINTDRPGGSRRSVCVSWPWSQTVRHTCLLRERMWRTVPARDRSGLAQEEVGGEGGAVRGGQGDLIAPRSLRRLPVLLERTVGVPQLRGSGRGERQFLSGGRLLGGTARAFHGEGADDGRVGQL